MPSTAGDRDPPEYAGRGVLLPDAVFRSPLVGEVFAADQPRDDVIPKAAVIA